MAHLLRDLHHTYQVGPRPKCRAIAAAFRGHYAPGFASQYLLFLEEDAHSLLEDIQPFGMAMFSNDIVERWNRFLKYAFYKLSARGAGKQKAIGQSACGCPEASIDFGADALGPVLQPGH